MILKDLFAADPKRFETYSKTYKASTEKGQDVEIFLDYSKNLIDQEVWKALVELAREAGESRSFLWGFFWAGGKVFSVVGGFGLVEGEGVGRKW